MTTPTRNAAQLRAGRQYRMPSGRIAEFVRPTLHRDEFEFRYADTLREEEAIVSLSVDALRHVREVA